MRNRYLIPSAIGVIALVLAMFGGAYASKGGGGDATASSSKSKRGPKGPRGKTGPAGAAGPQGAAGANGRDGLNGLDGLDGANGKDGKNGKDGTSGSSVTNTEFSGAEGPCTEGGSKLVGTGTTYACNGKKGADGSPGAPGSPWTAGGTLPGGSTETGAWGFTGAAVKKSALFPVLELNYAETTISFSLPLPAALPSEQVQVNPVGFPLGSSTTSEKENCPGSVEDPKAKAGFLCVYTGEVINPNGAELPTVAQLGSLATGSSGASKTGARLQIVSSTTEDPSYVRGVGSWAVTAPNAP